MSLLGSQKLEAAPRSQPTGYSFSDVSRLWFGDSVVAFWRGEKSKRLAICFMDVCDVISGQDSSFNGSLSWNDGTARSRPSLYFDPSRPSIFDRRVRPLDFWDRKPPTANHWSKEISVNRRLKAY